ncbi:hypothetical protein ABVV53_13970 [Novosphingobium sp. RD2P27]|uniref:Uncharacterized protein n=1 Tax=Novosphingobium kalidii TaxID=3230299 RepID=A0ABV2D3U7_9SPHN
MHKLLLSALTASALTMGAAHAADQDRPITNREPDVMDVAKTPVTDLNLDRTEIPALLVEAQTRPYSLQNLSKCSQLMAAVEEFNAILGPDLDLPQAERVRLSKGRIAQSVIGSFIPFRSIIREISGANKQEREILAAIQAGLARRGFLKGVGAARGCRYPASPATPAIVERYEIQLREAAERDEDEDEQEDRNEAQAVTAPSTTRPARAPQPNNGVTFTSDPVVQTTRR